MPFPVILFSSHIFHHTKDPDPKGAARFAQREIPPSPSNNPPTRPPFSICPAPSPFVSSGQSPRCPRERPLPFSPLPGDAGAADVREDSKLVTSECAAGKVGGGVCVSGLSLALHVSLSSCFFCGGCVCVEGGRCGEGSARFLHGRQGITTGGARECDGRRGGDASPAKRCPPPANEGDG